MSIELHAMHCTYTKRNEENLKVKKDGIHSKKMK